MVRTKYFRKNIFLHVFFCILREYKILKKRARGEQNKNTSWIALSHDMDEYIEDLRLLGQGDNEIPNRGTVRIKPHAGLQINDKVQRIGMEAWRKLRPEK